MKNLLALGIVLFIAMFVVFNFTFQTVYEANRTATVAQAGLDREIGPANGGYTPGYTPQGTPIDIFKCLLQGNCPQPMPVAPAPTQPVPALPNLWNPTTPFPQQPTPIIAPSKVPVIPAIPAPPFIPPPIPQPPKLPQIQPPIMQKPTAQTPCVKNVLGQCTSTLPTTQTPTTQTPTTQTRPQAQLPTQQRPTTQTQTPATQRPGVPNNGQPPTQQNTPTTQNNPGQPPPPPPIPYCQQPQNQGNPLCNVPLNPPAPPPLPNVPESQPQQQQPSDPCAAEPWLCQPPAPPIVPPSCEPGQLCVAGNFSNACLASVACPTDCGFAGGYIEAGVCSTSPEYSYCEPTVSCAVSNNVYATVSLPPTPTGLSGSCSIYNGKPTLFLSWNFGSDANRYAVRVDKAPYDLTDCAKVNGEDYCDEFVDAPYFALEAQSGASYHWWVHSINDAGWSSEQYGPTITCPTVSFLAAPELTNTLFFSAFTLQENSCPKFSLGDANCDDRINGADYGIWAQEVGGLSADKKADFNNDGAVNLVDFEIWRRNQ